MYPQGGFVVEVSGNDGKRVCAWLAEWFIGGQRLSRRVAAAWRTAEGLVVGRQEGYWRDMVANT